VELYLHPTNLHVHGVVLKLRANLEFLNFNMNRYRLVLKGMEALLGAFEKLRKVTVSFVMPVCPSVHLSIRPSPWNTSSSTGRNLMKFNTSVFFENLSRKVKFNYNMTTITGII
jgi:hypothetical protein